MAFRLVVEAAGVEPVSAENANRPMARDFSSQVVGNSLPCCQLVVLWSALESSPVLETFWRRAGIVSVVEVIPGRARRPGDTLVRELGVDPV